MTSTDPQSEQMISDRRQSHLKGLRRAHRHGKSIKQYMIGMSGLALLLVLWQASTTWLGVFDRRILPPPTTVAVTLVEMIQTGELLRDCIASLLRVGIGSAIAVFLGVSIGIATGASKLVSEVISPIIDFIRPISPIAWIPLAILWFGLGNGPAYFVIFLATFFPIVSNTHKGVSSISIDHLRAAEMCGFSGWQRVFRILLPAALPDVMVGIKVGIGIGWMAVIAAEFVAAQSGLGYLIEISRQLFNTPKVLAGMVTIGLLGFLITLSLSYAEAIVTPWKRGR
jgi:ABC-type nitrate/sulfonate/bicarbonate transport system permease component